MLSITIPKAELFDENKNAFVQVKGYEINLEHSLLSIVLIVTEPRYSQGYRSRNDSSWHLQSLQYLLDPDDRSAG